MDICINIELKPTIDINKRVCRCCLSSDKHVRSINPCSTLYTDISQIQISDSDGLPHWICIDCFYLLEKCYKFKHKIVKAHSILYEYYSRCTPFPLDAYDPELNRYATPTLNLTETLTFENNIQTTGFHDVLQHNKQMKLTDLNIKVLYPLKEIGNFGEILASDVKEENYGSDYEDDIPLGEIRNQIETNASENDYKDLLIEVKGKDGGRERRRNKRHKNGDATVKRKKRKIKSPKKELLEEDSQKTPIRKAIELDPTKIMIIKIPLKEQIEMREKMSRDPSYLKFIYKCTYCYRGFNHEDKLANHMRKHSPSRGKFKCNLCDMYLPNMNSLQVHQWTHDTRYQCMKCEKRMASKSSMLQHYSATHENVTPQYKCHICGKITHNDKTHRGHMRNRHSGVRPKCDQCGKTFVNKDSLIEHMLIHKGVKNYACETCGKRFRTRTQIKNHQIKHVDSKDFYCVECDTGFKSELNLRAHLQNSIKHRDESALKYNCSRCTRRFATARALEHHVSYQHEGRRLYSCSLCGHALATKSALSRHVRVQHQGYKPPLAFICHTCGKGFRSKNVLTNHTRTHTGEKPYECDECGRKFSQQTSRNTHVKLVHLKMKRDPNKLKPSESIPTTTSEQTVIMKQEAIYENWNQPIADVYFPVGNGP